MTDQELQAIRAIIQEELKPMREDLAEVKEDLEEVKEDLAEVKEDLSEVRSGVNTLLDWADKVGDSISFPLPKIVP